MPDDPTPRELLIQIQNLAQQVATLVGQIDDLTRTLGQTYVPRGEYGEARRGDNRRFEEIEKDIANQAGFRRQVAAAVIVGFILLAANIALAVTRLPGAGT